MSHLAIRAGDENAHLRLVLAQVAALKSGRGFRPAPE
jgi:hypothetical protein